MYKSPYYKRKKRKNGEGCFSTSTDGKYVEYRLSYIDENGDSKKKYFSAKTKEECIRKANKWQNEKNGVYTDDNVNSNWTVGQAANFWFEHVVKHKVKPTTISDDRSILDRHIIPGIGRIYLKDLNGFKLETFYTKCLEKDNGRGKNQKLSVKTVKNIYKVVNRLLKYLLKKNIIPLNYNEQVDNIPKYEAPEPVVLTQEEGSRLFRICEQGNTMMDIMIIFFMWTGIRLGEGLGLQWSKIDFFNNRVRIDQQLQPILNEDKETNFKFEKTILHNTKTKKSNRTISVNPDVMAKLRFVELLQKENKFKCQNNYRKDLDLVFAREDGYFVCDTTFRKFLNKRLEEANIKHIRIHDLRHSYATRLFECDVKTKYISSTLGHSNTRTTEDIYVHICPDQLEVTVEKTRNLYNSYKGIKEETDNYEQEQSA